ncbi:MAG: hypothetical protein AAFV86_07030 [Pseudomonadota bacterium]
MAARLHRRVPTGPPSSREARREAMEARGESGFAWGPERAGLQAGLRLVGRQDRGAGPRFRRLEGAVRNAGTRPAAVPGLCELRLRIGARIAGLAEGPHAIMPRMIAPGETVAAGGWRLDPTVPAPATRCDVTLWCLVGRDAWLRSGAIALDFGAG